MKKISQGKFENFAPKKPALTPILARLEALFQTRKNPRKTRKNPEISRKT